MTQWTDEQLDEVNSWLDAEANQSKSGSYWAKEAHVLRERAEALRHTPPMWKDGTDRCSDRSTWSGNWRR